MLASLPESVPIPTDAENIHQVFDWLWSSGQLSANDITTLPRLGIEVVINLAPPTSSVALPGEAELVTLGNMVYLQIPVSWERPELHQLMQFFGALETFSGCKIWLHCAMNMRASAFIYLYRRLCLGEDEELSAFPMREVWTPNPVWQQFIHDAIQHYPHIPRGRQPCI